MLADLWGRSRDLKIEWDIRSEDGAFSVQYKSLARLVRPKNFLSMFNSLLCSPLKMQFQPVDYIVMITAFYMVNLWPSDLSVEAFDYNSK